MAGVTELWCVRHGEATHNVAFRTQGEPAYWDPAHANSALTARGKAQARQCVLSGRPDMAVTSPLRRAADTAHIVLQPYADVQLVTLDVLREFPNGGHTPNHLFRTLDTWHPSQEESSTAFRHRIEEFQHWVQGLRDVRTLLVVGHTSFLQELLHMSSPLPHAAVVRATRRDSLTWQIEEEDAGARDD